MKLKSAMANDQGITMT
ncbi:hypothetical protein ACVNPX_15355 [Staphylococcus aureus]